MAENAWTLVQDSGARVLMKVGATAITKTYCPVVISSATIIPAGDGETVFGVAITKGAVGEYIAVDVGNSVYRAQAASGVNFALGADVYLAASYELDAGSTTNLACGKVVNIDPASAGLVEFILTPNARAQMTHA